MTNDGDADRRRPVAFRRTERPVAESERGRRTTDRMMGSRKVEAASSLFLILLLSSTCSAFIGSGAMPCPPSAAAATASFAAPTTGATIAIGPSRSRLPLRSIPAATSSSGSADRYDATVVHEVVLPPTYRIRDATYTDLPQAADLMTDGFYPDLRTNRLLRPMRYLLELERLQGNFPYEDEANSKCPGRHYYLVATSTATTAAAGGSQEEKVIGFCDIDGRIPNAPGANGDGPLSFSPFFKRVNRPQPYFSDLAVHPDHRRRGIASALMEEAELRAKRMGFEKLYLGVRSANELALRMYSKMGYEIIVPQGDMLAFLEVQKDVRMLRRSLD